MGCGSSKAISPKTQPSAQNGFSAPGTSPGSKQEIAIESRLNQYTALSKVERIDEDKPRDPDFVPATNIQYEIPEAFKHKEPLVPVGFSKLKALEPIRVSGVPGQDGVESLVRIENEVAEDKVSVLTVAHARLHDGRGVHYTFAADGTLQARAVLAEHKHPLEEFGGKLFWMSSGKGYMQQSKDATPQLMQTTPAVVSSSNKQFWGDYLFFVSEDGSFYRAGFLHGDVQETKLSVPGDKVLDFFFTPKGKLFTITGTGALRNGIQLNSKMAEEAANLQSTKTISLSEINLPDFLFYLLKDIDKAYFLAVADNSKSGHFGICLLNERLELLHMINFKKGGTDQKRTKPALIREAPWKDYRLIVSAREIFEIDLFLIAKNQIMHLQTFRNKDDAGADYFHCLEILVNGDWYLGGNSAKQSSQNINFLRKLVWDSA